MSLSICEITRKQLELRLSEIFNSTILNNPYIPHKPTPKQAEFLLLNCKEALYGGAAGGGKSDALLMAALQYVMIPHYSAILFRRTYADLALPGALMDRSMEWLGGTDAHFDTQKHLWTFPSGATLAFGNMERERDKFRYQSAEFQFVGFDELTQFYETQYRYMFSRMRRLEGSYVPLRMRGASNPGNIGHDWVKQRFLIEGEAHRRVFIPAKLNENPYLDRENYIKALYELDPITRRQYLEGDWSARHGGSIFKREYFKDKILDNPPAIKNLIRFWDRASTVPKNQSDPDYTVGLKLGELEGQYYILHVVRFRGTPKQNEDTILATAQEDGYPAPIRMEQEPGSSGVDTIDHYARQVLKGYNFKGVRTTGDKSERAAPVATVAEQGNLFLIKSPLTSTIIDELEAFPLGSHDDIVDALSGAYEQLRTKRDYGARYVQTRNIPPAKKGGVESYFKTFKK